MPLNVFLTVHHELTIH